MYKEQDLFSFPTYKIDRNKTIRLIELFAGIGAQAKALENLQKKGVLKQPFEHYKISEIDKYAVKSYNAIHGTSFETSDITQIHAEDLGIVDRDKYEYILTYSFPCTDISNAGKMKGYARGSGTRSGLLWEVERLLIECKKELPHILLMENVPGVLSDIVSWNSWLEFLRSKGYHNFYKVLNAKNYGVAQNRERAFMISILSDDYIEYDFPQAKKLEKSVVDYLEDEVDEKYYITSEKAKNLIKDLYQRGQLPQTDRQTDNV